jgi:hypothetical protein
MRLTIATTGGLALAAILAVAGCKSETHQAEIDATQARMAAEAAGTPVPPAATPTPGAAQQGQNLASFDLVFSGDGFVGRYVRNAPTTWVGPDPTNGQSVTWTATTAPERVVLTSGAVTLDINVSNGLVSSNALDPQHGYHMANQVFQ